MFNDAHEWLLLLLLLDVSIKTLLLAVVAAAGLAVFRVKNSHMRHRVWTTVLVGMLVMPLLVQIVPGLAIPIPALVSIDQRDTNAVSETELLISAAPSSESTSLLSFDAALDTPPLSPAPMRQHHAVSFKPSAQSVSASEPAKTVNEIDREVHAAAIPWEGVVSTFVTALLLAYIGVAVLLALRLALGISRAALLIRRSLPIEEARHLVPSETAGMLRESRLIRVPLTVGFLKPRVLLPLTWRSWSDEKRDAVIRHELTHVARGDCLVNLLAECNRCLYWFHPLAWWLTRWLSDLAERNCDDAVIASTGDRASYARHLLEIAASVVGPHGWANRAGVAMARSADVTARIYAILDTERPLSKRLGWHSTVCLVAVMLPTCWFAAALQAKTSSRAESVAETNRKDTESEAVSVLGSSLEENDRDVATFSGRVVDSDSNPVADALLSVVLWSYQPDRDRKFAPPVEVWAKGKSGADGSYELNYSKPADAEFYNKRAYRLTAIAERDGFGIGWRFLNFEEVETRAVIKLPEEQIRRGRLVDLEGQAVSSATIHVVSVGTPAPNQVTFRKYPFHDGMPLDETTDTKVPTMADGKGRWEHEIRFRKPPIDVAAWPKSVTTDVDGRFEIGGVGHDQAVTFHIYGTEKAGSQISQFGRSDDAEKPRTFALGPPRLVEGRVVDEQTGEPIAGARVRVDATGAALFTAVMPVLADWKGRQGHVGNNYAIQSNPPELTVPPVFTETDAEGRYRVNAMRATYGSPEFRVTVSSPHERPYLSASTTIRWPGATTFKQQADFKLPRGVRVRGQVVSATTGQPIPRARVDFWSPTLSYPFTNELQLMLLSPDGIQHPAWRKADFDGRFEIIVPRGKSYLLVNEGTDDNEVDRIELAKLGVQRQDPTPVLAYIQTPPPRTEQPHRFYPDRVVELTYDGDKKSDELKIELRKARVLRIRVVLPNGQPATAVQMYAGQEPFRQETTGGLSAIKKTGDGQFEIAHRDLDSPISVAFIQRKDSVGIAIEFTAERTGDEPVTVTLQPFGSATVRFVDAKRKPLTDFRPLVWMSLPKKPFSSALDLERLAT
jgi:beta-lactamase regulating signal transducer with metallopeptidase domain